MSLAAVCYPVSWTCSKVGSCIDGTIQTLTNTEGAGKTARLAAKVFIALAQYGIKGFEKLIEAFTWVAGVGLTIDLYKRILTLVDGQARDWSATAAAVCFAAYRALGMLKFLHNVQLFRLTMVVNAIGNLPYIGAIASVPYEVFGGFGALFDTIHHSKQLHYGIQAEVEEYEEGYECLRLQQQLIVDNNDKFDDRASNARWDRYEEHARNYVALRIYQGKEPALSKEQMASRLMTQMVKVYLAMQDKSEDYNKKKVEFEKRKFEILHRNAEANVCTKRWYSGLAIAANLAKMLFIGATIVGAVWGIALLAATTPLMLGFGIFASALGLARVVFEVNSKVPEPQFLPPKEVTKVEGAIKRYIEKDVNDELPDDQKGEDARIKQALHKYAKEAIETVC